MMRHTLFAALACWLAAVLACTVKAQKAKAPAPDLSFGASNGKTIKLSDYRGRQAVVLLFQRGFTGEFACYYCGLQTRAYKQGYKRVQAAGAEVLMVLPGADDARGYLRAIGESDEQKPDPGFAVPFPVLYDKDFSACKSLDVPFDLKAPGFPVSEPATFVIGKDGKLVYAYHGKNPGDRPSVDKVLEVLRRGKAPTEGGLPATGKKAAARPTLAWVSYEKAMKAARKKQKPIILDFYADW